MQVACALISTFAGCGDGLYTPGVAPRADASAKRDAAADTESGAFMTGQDAPSDTVAVDARPLENKVEVGGASVIRVLQGGASLTFEPQSFLPPAAVTIREVQISEDIPGVRGHYNPVFELTFAGGKPRFPPVLEIDLRKIVDEGGRSVVGLGKSLVLARYMPRTTEPQDQWLDIQQTTLADDGDSIDVNLVRKVFEFKPHTANKMIVGVLLKCRPAQDTCTGSCVQLCSERKLGCDIGGLCQ